MRVLSPGKLVPVGADPGLLAVTFTNVHCFYYNTHFSYYYCPNTSISLYPGDVSSHKSGSSETTPSSHCPNSAAAYSKPHIL